MVYQKKFGVARPPPRFFLVNLAFKRRHCEWRTLTLNLALTCWLPKRHEWWFCACDDDDHECAANECDEGDEEVMMWLTDEDEGDDEVMMWLT